MCFVIYSSKTGKCWSQNVFTNLENFVRFCKNSKISPNNEKSNRIFPGMGRGDRDLILAYLDSLLADIFPHYCLSFSILAILQGQRVVKVEPKVPTLGPSVFHENSNPPNFFQLLLVRIPEYWIIFGTVSAQKLPIKTIS